MNSTKQTTTTTTTGSSRRSRKSRARAASRAVSRSRSRSRSRSASRPGILKKVTVVEAAGPPKLGKHVQSPIKPVMTQMAEYVRAVIDPFNTPAGVKIPDAIIYPSTTFEIRETFDLKATAAGDIAAYCTPWFANWLGYNEAEPYNWRNRTNKDSAQIATIKAGFSSARIVAAGIRIVYTGAALTAAGTLTGALTDPFQMLPASYADMVKYPEYTQYSVSGESAGIEVFWKPMSLYNNVYRNVDWYPVPAGIVTAYFCSSAGTPEVPANVGLNNVSTWVQAGPATIGLNEHPFMVVAGKGFPDGAPFRCELVAHFEATVRTSTLLVGKVTPTVSHLNTRAMEQASVVIPSMPAARKPTENFIGKATNIISSFGDLLSTGFSVAERGAGLINRLMGK